jgi:hypothetical protein
MRPRRSRDPLRGTTFGRRFGTSIRFRLLPRFSELHISRLSISALSSSVRPYPRFSTIRSSAPLWHFGRLFRPTSSLSWCAGQRPAFLPSEHGYGLPHRLHWYFATYAIVDSRLQERFLGLIVSILLRSHAAPIRTAAVPPRNPCGRDDRVQIP